MDNAEHIKRLQDHAEDQARIIRSKNHTIKALRAQNSNLWCELQSRPETPSEALIERAEKAEADLADYQAMHSEQMKTIARLQENPRPLTADDITDEMVLRFMNTFDTQADGSKPAPTLDHFTVARTTITRAALIMALTPPPSRPEGAEEIEGDLIDIIGTGVLNDSEFDTISIKLAERGYRKTGGKSAEELQALIRQAEAEGEGADNESLANYLAARLTNPTVKEQS